MPPGLLIVLTIKRSGGIPFNAHPHQKMLFPPFSAKFVMNLISEVKQISSALILASKEAAASYLVDASYRLREVRHYVANNLYFFISRLPSEKARYLFLCYAKFNNLSSNEIVLTSKINLLLKFTLSFQYFSQGEYVSANKASTLGPVSRKSRKLFGPETTTRLLCKAGLFIFYKGNKNYRTVHR